jgi:Cu/Zn superoxide dismutase
MQLFSNVILSLFVASALLARDASRRRDGDSHDQLNQRHRHRRAAWNGVFADGATGLVITPRLSGLPPEEHGFHIHEKGDCGPRMNQGKPAAGFAAGGHYDPAHTKKHLGPLSTAGHRGDLPVLVVDSHTSISAFSPSPLTEQ